VGHVQLQSNLSRLSTENQEEETQEFIKENTSDLDEDEIVSQSTLNNNRSTVAQPQKRVE